MSDATGPSSFPDELSVIIVIAVSGIAAMIIAAWLVYQVARRAIDKATPDGVAAVVLALAALLNPLRQFLPWSPPGETPRTQLPVSQQERILPHNEVSLEAPQEAADDT